MPKSIIAEGKTTNEAISEGLKKLNVSKDRVDIKVLANEEKRSFFSILTPRIVKVELTLKENDTKNDRFVKKSYNENKSYIREEKVKREVKKEDIEKAKQNVEKFLKDFSNAFDNLSYSVTNDQEFITVQMDGDSAPRLIGYRGDVLNSLQIIINSIANKGCESKVRVIINIGDYKEKREKSLEELADKISKTVLRTGKSITLEPMVAYERKIIHNRLQQNELVRTYSIGDEPYRKVVIAKIK